MIATSMLALAMIAAPTQPLRVVVFELASEPELAPLARKTTDEILLYLSKKPGVSAVADSEVRLLVDHAALQKEMMRCESEDCLREVGRATDADRLITGHLGRWGEGHLVTLSLVNVEKKAVERGESATTERGDELIVALRPALDRLLGLSAGRAERRALSIGARATKVAVLDLSAYGAPQALADNLTQLLSLELKKVDGVSVISPAEIKAMLDYEVEKQIAQCKSDMECLREIGGALGVEYLVSGGVGKLEDTFVINLKLMNLGDAEVVRRVSETYRGPERHLGQALRFLANELLDRKISGDGQVLIATEVDEARAKVDAQPDAIALPQQIERLRAGKHTLATTADGYQPHFQEFYVEPETLTKVRPDLVAVGTPWYQEWWVWTIIGAAVAGGVATTVVIATDTPENGGVDVVLTRQ